MWLRRREGVLATLILACACQYSWAAGRSDESDVKAAIVYNLLLFVEWPGLPAPARGLRLCVLEDGALTSALHAHAGKKVQGAALEIHRIHGINQELDTCAAVMVEAGSMGALARLAVAARNRPLLVIAEGTGVAERGAMIGLHTDGGRIAFDINYGAMKRSGLTPSSKILRLARSLIE
jgi:hypothetical protein